MTSLAKNERRTGLVLRKEGMTRIFDDSGNHVPTTVLFLDSCQVTAQRTQERDGYWAVQLGCGTKKAKNTAKPQRTTFANAEVEPKAWVTEFRVGPDYLLPLGVEMRADHFVVGQKVDVQGKTIGKGFAGPMKRWNFRGLRASHGVSVSHRSHGSTGARQDPGRTFKGKKMAGQMGGANRTTQGLTVVRIDPDRGLIWLKGAVTGRKGDWVKVRDTVKSLPPTHAPLPGSFMSPVLAKPNSSWQPWQEELPLANNTVQALVAMFENIWARLGDAAVAQGREIAAYHLYRAGRRVMETDLPDESTSAGRRAFQFVEGLPAAAFSLACDDNSEVARAGALLATVVADGPSPSNWLATDDPAWSETLVETVRTTLKRLIVGRGLRFVVRPNLRKTMNGDHWRVTGEMLVFNRLPNLWLDGPIATDVPDWCTEAPTVTVSGKYLDHGEPTSVDVDFKTSALTPEDQNDGVLARATIDLSMPFSDDCLVVLRPTLQQRPLDPVYVDIDDIPDLD